MPVANTKALTLTDLLFEKVDAGLCLVAPDGTVVRANTEWLRATGGTEEQVVGENISDLFPDPRDMALAIHARAKAGHRVEVPRHAQFVNGRETWWEGSIEPVPMEGGTGLLITAREVRTEFQVFYETAPAAFLVLAPDRPRFTIVAASDAYLRATKTSRDIIGRGIFEVFPDDPNDSASTGSPARASFGRVLDTGAPDTMAVQKHSIRRPASEGGGFEERYWSPTNTPVIGGDGQVLYIHHRVEDVTEFVRQKQKGAEQQAVADMLRTRTGEMEADVLRRAQELQELNQRLRAANEKLAEFDRERQRLADERVREGTRLLRAISDTSADVIFAKDRDGRYRFANPAFLAVIGKPLDAVIGKTDDEVLGDEAARQVMENDCRVWEIGTAQEMEERVPLADGTERVWSTRKTPYRDESRAVVGLLGLSRDITERKRAEVALRESEERLRVALDAAAFGTFDFDPVTGRTVWDAQMKRIWGIAPDEDLDFHGVLARVHPDDRDRIREVFAAAVAPTSGGEYHAEYRIVRPDGSVRWCSANGRVYFAGEGGARRAVRVIGVEADVTDRRNAEAAFRESEGKYVAIFDKAPFGIALTKLREHTFVAANDAFLRMFGFTRDEVIGKTSLELGISQPASHAQVLEDLDRRGALCDLELWRRTKSGAPIALATSLERVTIDGSEFVLTTVQDITERRRAEEALRASEERVRLAQEVARVGSFEWNVQTGVNTWSPELEAMYGLPRGGFPGTQQAWESLVHPDDRAAALRAVEQAFEVPATVEGDWRVVWPDGSVHWLAGRFQVMRDGSGTPLRLTGINMDITERKKAEEALRASEELRRLAQMVARTGAFDWNMQSGVNTWTPELEALYGLPPGGFGGTEAAFEQLVHPEDRDKVLQFVERGIETGTPGEGEWRVVWPDGSVHWIVGRWQVIKDASGTPVRMAGINMDITERKRSEELHASEAALREADRHKNQFLAMLSHELRNPLAPIRNSLYILDRAPPGSEQVRRAQSVLRRQVGQLTWLIDDLLDVTRITHGKIQLQRERLDLNEVAHRVAEDNRSIFARSEVQLEVLPSSEEVWVDGDRVRLAQVIGNLLQNAAKFTPPGGRTTVSVHADAERALASLTVRDTGRGIQPDMLPRLFHAFSQAESTLDRSKGGLGLGLALVKGLVELHGGSVSAASDGPGKGAAFTLRLPIDGAAARPGTAQRGVAGDGVPRRVLVIEDNSDAADTFREVLELEKHVVEVAYTGREGIQKARAFHPDVVLCDIGLPEMDGYEVARVMRADPDLGRVALVAVSGYAQPEDVATGRKAGFDAHLAKPPSMDALERVLAEVGIARQDQPAARAPGSPSRA